MPLDLQVDLEAQFSIEDRKSYPDTCLYLLIQARSYNKNGLRPKEEVKQVLSQNLRMIYNENPALKYRIVTRLGSGA